MLKPYCDHSYNPSYVFQPSNRVRPCLIPCKARRTTSVGKIIMSPPGHMADRHMQSHGISSQEEYDARLRQRQIDKEEVTRKVLDPATPNEEKMDTQCKYIMQYGKTLFSCPRCWLLPGLCVCSRLAKATPKAKVIIHVHQLEWGKCSNTGTIVGLTLTDSELLLKGLKVHDQRLHEVFDDPNSTKAVLWPGENSILPSELKAIADEKTGGRITIIAVDATWRNAMRTKASYPSDVLFVKLTPESAVINERSKSLLSPVRKYRGDVETNARVCTLEAVASLLFELEQCCETRDTLISNLRIKVDANLIQKSRTPEYGTLTIDDLIGPPRLPKCADNKKVAGKGAKGKKALPEEDSEDDEP